MTRTSAAARAFEPRQSNSLADELRRFRLGRGPKTIVGSLEIATGGRTAARISTFTNAFWTARQRAAHSLHEVSYRACFKPQLPRFFVERLTEPGEIVYDPFMGRGTTLIEAALLGRVPYGCDVNPLSQVLCGPRLAPPSIEDVERALEKVDFDDGEATPRELRVFYHHHTLRQISALRKHLLARDRKNTLTAADRWIRMVAVNRLT